MFACVILFLDVVFPCLLTLFWMTLKQGTTKGGGSFN